MKYSKFEYILLEKWDAFLIIIFLLYSTSLNAFLHNTEIENREKRITVVIPSYNNAAWCQKNLNSIFCQKYTNFKVIYVDDHSTDSTTQLVAGYVQDCGRDIQVIDFDDSDVGGIVEAAALFSQLVNQEDHFFTLVRNVNRRGPLENLYRMVHSCQDEDIVVTVDGDDWLYHSNVFQELNEVYSRGHVWFTHGTLIEYPNNVVAWCEPIKAETIAEHSYRSHKCPSHLRTCYTWLFKKIQLEDLLYGENFFPMTGDMAIMFPLAEMAAERHAFIKNVNYVYNISNPINENKVDPNLQNFFDGYIRSKRPYQRLPEQMD